MTFLPFPMVAAHFSYPHLIDFSVIRKLYFSFSRGLMAWCNNEAALWALPSDLQLIFSGLHVAKRLIPSQGGTCFLLSPGHELWPYDSQTLYQKVYSDCVKLAWFIEEMYGVSLELKSVPAAAKDLLPTPNPYWWGHVKWNQESTCRAPKRKYGTIWIIR